VSATVRERRAFGRGRRLGTPVGPPDTSGVTGRGRVPESTARRTTGGAGALPAASPGPWPPGMVWWREVGHAVGARAHHRASGRRAGGGGGPSARGRRGGPRGSGRRGRAHVPGGRTSTRRGCAPGGGPASAVRWPGGWPARASRPGLSRLAEREPAAEHDQWPRRQAAHQAPPRATRGRQQTQHGCGCRAAMARMRLVHRAEGFCRQKL
jgi:hypothetical protein